MNCPNCDYALSPFDKDCPRCKAMEDSVAKSRRNPYVVHQEQQARARQEVKTEQQQHLAESFPGSEAPGYTSPPAEPSSFHSPPFQQTPFYASDAPSDAATQTRPPRRRWTPAVIGLVCVVTGVVIASAFGVRSHEEQQAAAAQQTQQQAKLADLDREGFDQCVAGDEEGCHYYMDRLRDANQVDDSEFLKANLIVSTYLNNNDFTYQSADGFRKYGTLDKKDFEGLAMGATVTGDRAAADALDALADAGPPARKFAANFPPMPPGWEVPADPPLSGASGDPGNSDADNSEIGASSVNSSADTSVNTPNNTPDSGSASYGGDTSSSRLPPADNTPADNNLPPTDDSGSSSADNGSSTDNFNP